MGGARRVKRWVGGGVSAVSEIADDRAVVVDGRRLGADYDRHDGGFALHRTVRLARAPLGPQAGPAAARSVAVLFHGT